MCNSLICIRFSSVGKNFKVCHPKSLASLCRYGIGPSCHLCYIVLYLYLFKVGKSTNTVYSKKKTRSLPYIDTDFRWVDSRGIRYNRFYVIANYVISVVTCIHFKRSSAGPRRGLRNNRELRYIGLRYIDSWLYWVIHSRLTSDRKSSTSPWSFINLSIPPLKGQAPCLYMLAWISLLQSAFWHQQAHSSTWLHLQQYSLVLQVRLMQIQNATRRRAVEAIKMHDHDFKVISIDVTSVSLSLSLSLSPLSLSLYYYSRNIYYADMEILLCSKPHYEHAKNINVLIDRWWIRSPSKANPFVFFVWFSDGHCSCSVFLDPRSRSFSLSSTSIFSSLSSTSIFISSHCSFSCHFFFVLRRFVPAASSACFFPFFLPPPNPQSTVSVRT